MSFEEMPKAQSASTAENEQLVGAEAEAETDTEQQETRLSPEEQELVAGMREGRPWSPETQAKIDEWCNAQQELVDAKSDAERPKAQIKFNLQRARILLEAGYQEDAIAELEEIAEEAWNHGLDDLTDRIMRQVDKIKASMAQEVGSEGVSE